MIRKFISELMGTMLLVIFGCGTAVAANQLATKGHYPIAFNTVVIALAFGLILLALCYTIGKVSGCHVNPAVSIAMAINKKIKIIECLEYIVAQIIGGILGASVLALLFNSYDALGANGFGKLSALNTEMVPALIIEGILTFVFVLVVLCVTSKKEDEQNSGIIIGLTLTLVHLFGIPFTGTSVNPARSIGPALLTGSDLVLEQLWVFIVGPIVGAIIAALFFKFVIEEYKFKKTKKK